MIIGYSRLQQLFLIITKNPLLPGDCNIQRIKIENLADRGEVFGECLEFQVDNTQKFIIAAFNQTNKLVVLDIDRLEIVLKVCSPDIQLKHVWLDETGCFLAALNEKLNAVNIYILEWGYEVQEPQKPLKQDNGLDEMLRQAVLDEAKRLEELERLKTKQQTKICSLF